MFSTSSKIPALVAGCLLAVLAQAAGAQTLAGIQGLMKEGKMTQALDEADRYIAAQPKDAQGPFAKGLILAELGRAQEAIAVFTRLTETFPGLPEPYNNLAVLYAAQKQYDKAQAALEMAIRTHPSYAVAHENLGDIYAKLASQAYDRALQPDAANRAAPQIKLSMIGELTNASPGRAGVKPVPPTKPDLVVVGAASTVTPPTPQNPPPPARAEARATEAGKTGEIDEAVRDWAAAWSRKDVAVYLAAYASDFQTPNGIALRKWQEERRLRIDKPGKLQVTVSDIKVTFSESGAKTTATARFRQQYVSATLKSQTSKTLVFVKSGPRWLIAQERVF